jgi:hypothetical protein
MLAGRDDPGESRMGEISMSGLTRERGAAVIGLWAFHPVLSSLLYWLKILAEMNDSDRVQCNQRGLTAKNAESAKMN